jgi:hypothetical protein
MPDRNTPERLLMRQQERKAPRLSHPVLPQLVSSAHTATANAYAPAPIRAPPERAQCRESPRRSSIGPISGSPP